jgi:beta-lactamase regulating signal transducer with metallopeptidase domain
MSLSNWTRLLVWISSETILLVAGAAVLQACLRSPRARRTTWRAAVSAVALVLIVELSGLREEFAGPDVKQSRLAITAMVLPPSAQQIGADNRRAEAQIAPATRLGLSLVSWPAWIWLAGTLLLLARFFLARVWLALRRRAAAPADPETLGLIARWQTSFGLRRVQSQVWPGLRGPVAFGIFRPTIALPPDFAARFSSAEREAMLAHELAHLAAHDPFWLMVSDTALALAWWHPLVWWARCKLQFANETAADEASALIPGGAHALAECLVRLGRELTAPGPARALGIAGNGPRSQLAARVERLLRGPRIWQPPSVWARWTPHLSAIFVALASVVLPVETGFSGSILAVLAAAAPVPGDVAPSLPTPATVTNQASAATPAAAEVGPELIAPPVRVLAPAPSQPAYSNPGPGAQTKPNILTVASLVRFGDAGNNSNTNATRIVSVTSPSSRNAATNLTPKVSLVVQLVLVTEHGSDDIGLDWIFGLEPNNNPAVETSNDWVFGLAPADLPALETNHNNLAPRTSPTHPKNLVIDRLCTDGQSAILRPEQFAALRGRIVISADILTAPPCAPDSGCLARLRMQDLTTVVTGVQAQNGSLVESPSVNYLTDDIAYGVAVDVTPTLEANGKCRVRVRASDTEFLGYDKSSEPKSTVSAPAGGKPLSYEIPHPHFRAAEADAEDSVPLGQTLVLRGPLWFETTKTKAHFLVSAKTKTIRQRLYVFITPSLAPPSDKKE